MEGTLDDLNDIQFIEQLKSGDQGAFKVLFDRLSPKLCAFILRYGVNSHDAEELTADTMLKVHKAIRGFDLAGSAKLTTWVFEIAKNTTIDHLRQRQSAEKKFPIEPMASVAEQDFGNKRAAQRQLRSSTNRPLAPESGAEPSSQVIALRKALNSLSEEDQDILRMKTIMSYEEISQVLDVAVGTLRVRHSRAVARLKEAYGKESDNER